MTRTYLIVGHSSGIGLALTRLALEAGHAVVGLSRRPSSITVPGLSERHADVLDADLASLDLPAALDGVAYCPGSLNLKSVRALQETNFLDDFRESALGAGACCRRPRTPSRPDGSPVWCSSAPSRCSRACRITPPSRWGVDGGMSTLRT